MFVPFSHRYFIDNGCFKRNIILFYIHQNLITIVSMKQHDFSILHLFIKLSFHFEHKKDLQIFEDLAVNISVTHLSKLLPNPQYHFVDVRFYYL